MTHVQDGRLLAFEIDGGHEIGTRRDNVFVGTEGETIYCYAGLITAYGLGKVVVAPAGSRTALTDIDNKED